MRAIVSQTQLKLMVAANAKLISEVEGYKYPEPKQIRKKYLPLAIEAICLHWSRFQ
jgi:hypothetical protein